MERFANLYGFSCLTTLLLACSGGGATETGGGSTTPPPQQEVSVEPPAEEPAEEPVAEEQPEPAEEPVAEQEAPPPAPEPLRTESAEEIQQALIAAGQDVVALRRLIDPRWGIGTYDPDDTGIGHHCDLGRLASLPGLGFSPAPSDRFQCDRQMERCSFADQDRHGYAFYLRRDRGAVWLNAVVHYPRSVPGRDSSAVRAFVQSGDGVCDLWRSLRANESGPPQKFSVFVSGYTGLVPETVSEHKCGDEAAAAFQERLAPYLQGGPTLRCNRHPSRCTLASGDEEVTIYGDGQTVTGVAVTRPRMRQDLDRGQQRELDAFLRGLARHSCDQ